jgi:flagellar motor component MotA
MKYISIVICLVVMLSTVSSMMIRSFSTKTLATTSKAIGIRGGSKSAMYMSTIADTPIKMKSKECKSLSNRAVFKCMDILDNLKTLKN